MAGASQRVRNTNRLSEEHFEVRLRELINRRKLTVKEAALRIGISESSLHKILNGISRPRLATVIAAAIALDTTLDWLCSDPHL